MSSNPGLKSRKTISRVESLPKHTDTFEDRERHTDSAQSINWLGACEWSCLIVLLAAAIWGWNRQVEPYFGASWTDPWPTTYPTVIGYALFASVDRLSAHRVSLRPTEREPRLVYLFLWAAWIQPLRYLASPALSARPAFAVRLLVVDSVESYSFYQLFPWGHWSDLPRTKRLRWHKAVYFIIGLFIPIGIQRYAYKYGVDTSHIFLQTQLGSIAAKIPYQYLPSGFFISWVVTLLSATMAILLFVRRESSRSKPTMLSYSIISILTVSPVLHGLFLNTHSPLSYATATLNARLSTEGFELLARGDGRATGYASVLQNNKDGFRAMRCGHSLLGGHWLQSPGIVKDPIYGVFVMLEAVRLVVPKDATDNVVARHERLAKGGSVLVIGLGIGTAPAAFIHHGMDVTIVEIDQIVYDFAVEYFELPPRHKAVIGDAVEFVTNEHRKLNHAAGARQKSPSAARGSQAAQYDFIVHDVFTGGVEPAILFSVEFLKGLKALLRPYGTIAINYAGDFNLPSTQMVMRTILAVFPTCRIFRESEVSSEEADSDQTNVVLFCRKVAGDFEFRRPTQADFLGAPSREQWLMPQHEVAVDEFRPKCAARGDCFGPDSAERESFVWYSHVDVLEKWQAEAGRRHWELMRTVIPPLVWDNW